MIQIKNLHDEKCVRPWDVKIDRSSPLGNPYIMSTEEEREFVCNKYEGYFYEQIGEQNKGFLVELNFLFSIYRHYGKLNLFCWCAPKRCHGETIKKFLEELKQQTL